MVTPHDDTTITAPIFCYECQYTIVHGCGFEETDPWRSLVIVSTLALFQATVQDPRIVQRCAGDRDPHTLSLVLAEIGCLGCFKPKTRDAVIADVRQHGLDAFAKRTRESAYPDMDAEGV